ncbi:hypothetical protein [Xanthovirga aplysinae]|uniref:hypothetical protein n=1 Tax=Xanthovirga aplysinae TaxID=2529853 RepID=UPI0012BC60BF|nr:hypothetical protein [Xanthovirga aplysinae]MTI30536.1 hypothetical protein [Xanthovirga aplysinae]
MKEKTNTFSIQRVGLLIKRQLVTNQSILAIAFGAGAGILLMIGIINCVADRALDLEVMLGTGLFFFALGSQIITSNVFSELNNPEKGFAYLILPASSLEKTVAAWISTTILYALAGSLIIFLAVFLGKAFAAMWNYPVLNTSFHLDTPVDVIIILYLISNALFLVGASHFKKYNFLKTHFTLALVLFSLILIGAFMAWVILPTSPSGSVEIRSEYLNYDFRLFVEKEMEYILKGILYLLAPFFLVVTYFKIKEREV